LRIERRSPRSRAGEMPPAPDRRQPIKHGLCHRYARGRTAEALDTIRILCRRNGSARHDCLNLAKEDSSRCGERVLDASFRHRIQCARREGGPVSQRMHVDPARRHRQTLRSGKLTIPSASVRAMPGTCGP